MKLPNEVQKVLNAVDRMGLTGYIAGGAARDVFFGMKPTDYDVVIPNTARLNEASAFDLMQELLLTLHTGPEPTSIRVDQAYDSASTDFDKRWLCLGQVEYRDTGVSVDILIARVPNIGMVLDGFDSNVNQCYLSRETGNVYYPHGIPDELRFLKPITTARFQRLLEVAVATRLMVNPTGLELTD